MVLQLLSVFTVLSTVASATYQQSAVVNTTLGPIQGLRKSVKGQPVDVYYGIPFAKPPVGDLRFKHPEPADPWTELKETVTKPNTCFQKREPSFTNLPEAELLTPNTPLSEDCLYLNVWVPRGFSPQSPRATMVWIHGGSYAFGSSTLDLYDGANLAAAENVIVVTMNYRLGTLGFFSSGTEDAPGNQGLMDQVMALKWVHDNVANFGGSNDTITIFGQSAGAVCVGLHLFSPLSMNYFSRAIMQSGSPIAELAVNFQSESVAAAHMVASTLGCPISNASDMIHCLQQVDAETITIAIYSVPVTHLNLHFAPMVDGYFLPRHPKDLLAKNEIKDTEIILGINKDEGMYFLVTLFPYYYPPDNSGQMSRSDLENVVKFLFPFDGNQKKIDAIMYEYVDSVVPSQRESYRNIGDDIWGDELFKCPTLDFAMAYTANVSASRSVYLYSYEHRLSNNPWPAWTGVMHGDEKEAPFSLPLDCNYTDKDLALASRMTGYWTRFAESGEPTDCQWSKMTSQGLEYLNITAEGDTMEEGLRHQQCAFCRNILPLMEEGTDC